jgi:ABC-type Mn2+/Zn2+ transport system permease subunit
MGIPFPVGLSWTSKHYSTFVPWAWGINGYATVIGSVLSVILALNFGFRAVLLIATAIYIFAYFAISRTPVPEKTL